MRKARLLDTIRKELQKRLEQLTHAAREAHAAATDPDSKAEGKYDTRSVEASYLAEGQAKQVKELTQTVRVLETFTAPDFAMDDPIGVGALVEIDLRGECSLMLLAPSAGGMVVTVDGEEVTLLTPSSMLYQKLLGKRAGEFLEDGERLILEVR